MNASSTRLDHPPAQTTMPEPSWEFRETGILAIIVAAILLLAASVARAAGNRGPLEAVTLPAMAGLLGVGVFMVLFRRRRWGTRKAAAVAAAVAVAALLLTIFLSELLAALIGAGAAGGAGGDSDAKGDSSGNDGHSWGFGAGSDGHFWGAGSSSGGQYTYGSSGSPAGASPIGTLCPGCGGAMAAGGLLCARCRMASGL